jgi:competence protein ComEC
VIACALTPPLLYRTNTLSLLSITALGLILGCYRGTIFRQSLLPYSSLAGRTVSIRGVARDDAVYGKQSQGTFDLGHIDVISPAVYSLPGTMSIGGYGEAMIYRGDTVLVTGKLYPTRGSKQASIGYAKLEIISRGTSRINDIRRRFVASLQSVLPAPLGSFGLGLLVGQRSTLPDSLNDQLSAVGLTHIVAVSGYNLTILVQFIRRLMRGRSKYQSIVLMLSLIGLFVAMTGSSASIVRASLVSALSLWAWYYGRTFRPSVLILLVAALSAGWFPPYLWSDIGWHLSFLAFGGILILAPLLNRRIFRVNSPHPIILVCIETISAQAMTFPIILYVFGRLSTIALISNLIIVPLVPIAMALTFIAGLAGVFVPVLAGWISYPARLVLTFMIDCVRFFASFPHSSVQISISTFQLCILYGSIFAVMLLLWRKTLTNDKITE